MSVSRASRIAPPLRPSRIFTIALAALIPIVCLIGFSVGESKAELAQGDNETPAALFSVFAQNNTTSDYPDHIINNDFEYPVLKESYFDKNDDGEWSTYVQINPIDLTYYSVGDGRRKLSSLSPSFVGWRSNQTRSTDNGTAHAGDIQFFRELNTEKQNQYVELISNQEYTYIYQDISTPQEGRVYKWQLDHCSRAPGRIDSMSVKIGEPGKETVQTATRIRSNENSDDKVGEEMELIATDNTKFEQKVLGEGGSGNAVDFDRTGWWETYEGVYVTKRNQPITRFTFTDVGGTAEGFMGGNCLDNISFAICHPLYYVLGDNATGDLPIPVASGKYPGYHPEYSKQLLSNKIPTREGYTFLGWSATPHEDVTSYVEAESLNLIQETTIHDGNNYVYAVWAKNPTVKFFDPISNSTFESHSVPFGTSFTDELPEAPSHSGYVFSSYTTAPTDPLYEDYTVFAQYDQIIPTSASITWKDKDDADQIRSSSFPQDSITLTLVHKSGDATKNKTIHLDATNDKRDFEYLVPTDEADTFPYDIEISEAPQGYSLTANAQVQDGHARINVTATHVGVVRVPITKIWREGADDAHPDHVNILMKSVHVGVQYDANGGYDAPEGQTKNASSATFAVAQPGSMSRPGYTFMGWSEMPNASVAQYAPGENIHVSKNTTLYAVWQIKLVKVTWCDEDGITIETKMIPEGADYQDMYPCNPDDPYGMWKEPAVDADGNITIQWMSLRQYNIVYLSEEDDGAYDLPETTTEYGPMSDTTFELTLSSQVPRKAGKEFNYWRISWKAYSPSDTYTFYTSSNMAAQTYTSYAYAVWKNPTTVTWYDYDRSTVIDGPKTWLKANGDPEPTTDAIPSRAEDENCEYEFIGWHREESNSRVRYYAQYRENIKNTKPISITINYVDKDRNVIKSEEFEGHDQPTYDCSEYLDKTHIPDEYYLVGVTDGDPIEGISDSNKVINIMVTTGITVTWRNYDGTILSGPMTFRSGDPVPEAESCATPSRPSDGTYTYEFNKWSKSTDESGNITYTASYRVIGVNVPYGSTVTLLPSFDDESANITWRSDAPGVATVDENGVVTGSTIGTTQVTAICNGKEETFVISVIPVAPPSPVDPSPVDPTPVPMSFDCFSAMSLTNPCGETDETDAAFYMVIKHDMTAVQNTIISKEFTEPNGNWQQDEWVGYIELPAWDADTEEEFEYELLGEEKVDGYALIKSSDTMLDDEVVSHTFVNSKVADVDVAKEWVGNDEPDNVTCQFFLDTFVLDSELSQENQGVLLSGGDAGDAIIRDVDMIGEPVKGGITAQSASRMIVQHNIVGYNLAPVAQTHFECTATADSNWLGTFANVPLYDADGSLIDYTISENEDIIPGWTMVATYGDTLDGYHVVNSPATSAQIVKIWDDNNDERKIRPDEVRINLVDRNMMNDENDNGDDNDDSDDGGLMLMSLNEDTEEPIFVNKFFAADLSAENVNEDGNWTATIEKMPLYDENGDKIDYVVNEMVPYGYAPLVEGSIDEGIFTVTNTYRHQDILVSKTWNDDGYLLYRPKELELQLIPLNPDGSYWDIAGEMDGGMEPGGDSGIFELFGYSINRAEDDASAGEDDGEDDVVHGIGELPAVDVLNVYMNVDDKDTVVEGNQWCVTLHNVPVYLEDGTPISYAIEEPNVPYGYNLASVSYDADKHVATIINSAWERTSLPSVGLNAILLFVIAGGVLAIGGFTGAMLKRRAKVKAMYMGNRAKKGRKK